MRSPKFKKRSLIVGSIVVMLLATVGFWVHRSNRRPADLPVYDGKTAEQWFYGDGGHPGYAKAMKNADIAFEAMGTNCIPFLLDKARVGDTSFNRFYCWVFPKLPSRLQDKMKAPVVGSYVQLIAIAHLNHLEEMVNYDYMADDLMNLTTEMSDVSNRRSAYFLAERSAIRLDDVGRKRDYFISFLDDPDFKIQLEAAITLSRIDRTFTNSIPILIAAVTNMTLVRSAYAQSISNPGFRQMRLTNPALLPSALAPFASRFDLVTPLQNRALGALSLIAPDIAGNLNADGMLGNQTPEPSRFLRSGKLEIR